VRNNNEDAIAEAAELGLLVLADGMGGYNAGEVASGIAVATVLDTARREWKTLPKGETDKDSKYSYEALMLRDAVETAHTTIYQVAQSQPQTAGMGTTIVTCLFHDDRMSIAYVGDSRLYRLRDGQYEQVTRDHSLLEELVAHGHYSREEASRIVRKNIVTRALGVEQEVKVDIIEQVVKPNDIFLLCSDGLSDMLSDEEQKNILMSCLDNLPEAAKKLVEEANLKGGRDNISVVLARINGSFSPSGRWINRLLEWF
jgi:protein phosphatase